MKDYSFAIAALATGSLIASCGSSDDQSSGESGTVTLTSVTVTEATTGQAETSSSSDGSADETGAKLDFAIDTTGGQTGCGIDANCTAIDVVFVIDNSGTMGEEQLNLAANFPLLIDQLQTLTDSAGFPVTPSVNIMVTTTDFGHPLCTPFQKPDYTPRRGAPVYEGCNARINRFTGLDPSDPLIIEEACTTNCPVDVAPGDQFLHFDSQAANVPGMDPAMDAAKALSCIGPQGIDGCGYEAPLETMLQAINPEACWNDPTKEECQADLEWGQFNQPFLRDGALLALVIVTDEADCSVAAPNGYSYFTNDMMTQYWEVNPHSGTPQPSMPCGPMHDSAFAASMFGSMPGTLLACESKWRN